jgi:hypothetical protein
MSSAPPTHYQVLGVAETASLEDIHSAYRAAARDAHPDSGGRGDRMQHLNSAWHVLKDRGRRATYDAELLARRVRPPPSPTDRTAATGPRPSQGAEDLDDLDPYDDVGADPYEDDDFVFVGFDPQVVGVEGWWAMLPPGVLLLGLALFSAGFLFGSPALLVFSGGALLIALGLFVLVPIRAMLRASRRHPSREE